MVTFFNVFDTLGRFVGGYPAFQISMTNRLWIQVIGFGRLPLAALAIIIMVYQVSYVWLIMTNLCLFAFTNGYLAAIC